MFGELGPETGWDIKALSLDEPTSTTALIQTPAHEVNATLSPDGEWLAYQSNESGRDEIYVQDFPDLSGKWQVSRGGGQWPVWDPAGTELYYRQDQQMMSVAIGRNEGLSPGGPRELFRRDGLIWYGGMAAATISAGRNYAVAPDGERFLVIQDELSANEQARTDELIIVLNWYQELKQLVSTDN